MSLRRSCCTVLLLTPIAAMAVDYAVVADHPDGLYEAGGQVVWTITPAKGDAPAAGVPYTVKSGGLTEVAKGTATFAGGTATISAGLDQPGTLLLTLDTEPKKVLGGAAFAWTEIKPSAPEPADFDAFWKDKLAELAKVPVEAQLEAVESGDPKVQLWKITMGNIRGSHIHGYLARPVGDQPCPAMLQVQYAGVYPLKKEWVVGPARSGWLALDIIAHDLPVDEDAKFYADQSAGPLKNYAGIGSSDRDTSYFLRMYLSCYRAADYLATRPDWNRKTLLVQGGSQGGLQTVVTAALHPAVTAATACVPAGCDHTGPLVGRAPGWPGWITWAQGKDREVKATASTYYDVVNFARRVHCPILIGMGLIDTTCPPAGVFAMFNQLTAPKRIVIMPPAGHMGPHNAYYGIMGKWWAAAHDGKAPPLE